MAGMAVFRSWRRGGEDPRGPLLAGPPPPSPGSPWPSPSSAPATFGPPADVGASARAPDASGAASSSAGFAPQAFPPAGQPLLLPPLPRHRSGATLGGGPGRPPSGSPGSVRRRLQVRYHDRLFRTAKIDGLTSREFEVDLLAGERIRGEPIRVRLTKSISCWRRLAFNILSFGLYEVWHRCCASGSRIFDVDARLAVTSRGRLLLWTHSAAGGGLPLAQHCLREFSRPAAVAFYTLIVIFFAFGPNSLGIQMLQAGVAVGAVSTSGILMVLVQWLFERASLAATTTVRQFEAKDLSCVRLVCYSWRSFFGIGGEVTLCQVHMFFGMYPYNSELARTLPRGAFDSESVQPTFMGGMLAAQAAETAAMSRVQAAAGQDFTSAPKNQGFTNVASAVLIFLAFAAFLDEMVDFFSQYVKCLRNPDDVQNVSECMASNFAGWWTPSTGSSPQTVASHWIESCDWSLQIILFFYVIGPAASLLWSAFADQSSAGIGFVVDRRAGSITEDERFEEHWQEVTAFVAELFEGACKGRRAGLEAEGPAAASGGEAAARAGGFREILGDVLGPPPSTPGASTAVSFPGAGARAGAAPKREDDGDSSSSPSKPRSSWRQVEEMTRYLLEPVTGLVRVYRGVLSCLHDEKILAVYPEKVHMTIVVKIKILLTCGLEYWCHWRRHRYEGAIVLTDRRLIQVSSYFSWRQRSLKVDMFSIGCTKYVAINPPSWALCRYPQGRMAIASHLGTLEVHLYRMRRVRQLALKLWQMLVLLQDAPSVAAVELNDWVTVLDSELHGNGQDGECAAGDAAAEEEARMEAALVWGASPVAARPPPPGQGTDAFGAAPPRGEDVEAGGGGGGAASSSSAAAPAGSSPDAQTDAPVALGGGRSDRWGLNLAAGERTLWGPCLFDQEVMPVFWFCMRRAARRRKRPSALVMITDRRLVVVQYRSLGPLGCGGICHRVYVTSVAIVPLRWVLGFCIEESLFLQEAPIVRALGKACCWPLGESSLTVRVLTNAGMGKVYLAALSVWQRTLPLRGDHPSTFEEEKVLELRRWLGNLALFFGEHHLGEDLPDHMSALELWRCPRGWAPA